MRNREYLGMTIGYRKRQSKISHVQYINKVMDEFQHDI